MTDDEQRFDTRAIVTGERPADHQYGDVVSPIHLATTFAPEQLGDVGAYTYTRNGNPTRDAVEERLASLEGGTTAIATASGMGAIGTVAMSLLEPGDHVVAFTYLYGGTRKLFDDLWGPAFDVDVEYVDATSTAAVEDAVTPETRLVWMENPTNPLMKLCDVEAIAAIADANDAVCCVDNTFMSPYFQRPLDCGADVVVHSTTKYLNGHTDSLGGAIITGDDALAERFRFVAEYGTGAVLAPFDSYLLLRGTKTLPARMRAHETNATAIAEFLAAQPAVRTVHYPSLDSHPQHELAAAQLDGFGGMLSFEIDGDADDALAMLQSLSEITPAVSLGGVESLIAHVPTMTHYYLDEATRHEMGITDSLIRLSVGLEHVDDLIADLERGFAAMGAVEPDG